MSGYNTYTSISTYTVVDIRKTFEGFSADLRMIALRTAKWAADYTENVIHDVLKLAEARYLKSVDITLVDSSRKPLRASRYEVNEKGSALTSERPGGNNWPNLPSTELNVIVVYNDTWHQLTKEQKEKFASDSQFKIKWSTSTIDNSYEHLNKENGQLYGSKGYELKKQNFN